MSYILCEDLVLGYNGVPIVSNLNFSVDKGEYLCIVGENGTGKSTLIKTLLGLQNPMSGNIVMSDGLKPYEIGYLPQQTIVQKDFPASPWEIVLSGTLSKCGMRPFYSKKEKKTAEENMKKLGIWDLKNECYRYLSGGQQQRILLARALCATSKIILLDEPVTGLDPKVTTDLYNLIKEINNEGVSVIMVSHDICSINYATNVLYMKKTSPVFYKKEDYINSNEWKLFQNMSDSEIN